MARRSALLMVGAALGAVTGIPIGMYLGRQVSPGAAATASAPGGHYSPEIYTDPRFVDQLRPTVEALERSCRRLGEHCREARAARGRLSELDSHR